MMHILICEDDIGQRTHIESAVKKTIATENVKMKLILSSGDPINVLAYLEAYPNKRGLYFLDIDLQHNELDGIKLAIKIREADPSAKIVFITTHSELAHLTFKYKVAALDFIIKDEAIDIGKRVRECMLIANERYLQEKSAQPKYYKVNANGEVWNVPLDEILFFETHSNIKQRVILYTENSKLDFRGILRDIEKHVPEFYRCHQSYIVNPAKIVHIDRAAKVITLVNDTELFVAKQKISELARMMDK